MASATVQRKEPAPPEIVSVTLVLSLAEAQELELSLLPFTYSSSPLHGIWAALFGAGMGV